MSDAQPNPMGSTDGDWEAHWAYYHATYGTGKRGGGQGRAGGRGEEQRCTRQQGLAVSCHSAGVQL